MIKKGDKIKTAYGERGTVIRVLGTSVFTTIDNGSYVHITKLTVIG